MKRTVADQADPRAIEIIETIGGPMPASGYLPEEFWSKAVRENRPLVEELMLICKRDFPTYCAVLVKVVPKGANVAPFLFNRPQRLVWAQIVKLLDAQRPIFLYILKARQLGMSTLFAALIMWMIWRQNDVKTAVITHEKKLAEHILGMMRVAHEHYPDVRGIKPELRQPRGGATIPREEVYYKDRRSGVVIHVAKNLDPRGMSVSVVLESEAAFYPHLEDLNSALMPQLPSLGTPERLRCVFVMESTPKGQNDFYDYYMSAEPCYSCQATYGTHKGHSEAKSLFLPWMVHDEPQFGGYAIPLPADVELTEVERKEQKRLSLVRRAYDGRDVTDEQMYWRRIMLEDKYRGDEDFFNMEYPSDDISCFLLMSDSAFRHVMRYLQATTNDAKGRAITAWSEAGKTTEGPVRGKMSFEVPTLEGKESDGKLLNVKFLEGNGPLTVWEPPVKGERYVAFLDPCNGIQGGDSACIQVCSVRRARQVAEWVDLINPVRAVDMLCAIGTWYNNALINAEINIQGYTVLNRANERIYNNQFRWPKFDEANRLTSKRFWETTPRSRGMMFSTMMHWFEEKMVAISSPGLLGELSTFEKTLDSGEEQEFQRVVFRQQRHRSDDRVMAFAGALQTIKQSPKTFGEFTPFSAPPSAAELGLQGQRQQQAAVALRHAAENDVKSAELLEKLTGEAEYTWPWNPIREGAVF